MIRSISKIMKVLKASVDGLETSTGQGNFPRILNSPQSDKRFKTIYSTKYSRTERERERERERESRN